MQNFRVAAVLSLFMVGGSGARMAMIAAANEGVAEAKALYAAASYDDALAALADLDTAEAYEYRALCLLALGRAREAEEAAEAMVQADPRYEVSAEERPPRFVKLVADAKRRALPAVIRTRFAQARQQFQTNNRVAAREQFALVLALSEAPEVVGLPELADVRLLATGFSDLLAAADEATPPPVTPAASPSAAVKPPTLPATVVTQPEPIRQPLPPIPPTLRAAGRVLTGAIKVTISADGRVKAATIDTSVHPFYDPLLLAAASGWIYKPATINGKAVEIDRVVQVRVDR
jgi:tetratricopeptide (TPR) repeat protein